MDFLTQVKLAVYRHFADHGAAPSPDDIAADLNASRDAILDAYKQLRQNRVLLVQSDGATIRMAPPFSGVPTQHHVRVGATEYYANCAWDALGIPAALHKPGTVESRCEQSMEPLNMEVGLDGPPPSDWLFHSLVPAAKWWNDLVFT
jgi:hypothetical protein